MTKEIAEVLLRVKKVRLKVVEEHNVGVVVTSDGRKTPPYVEVLCLRAEIKKLEEIIEEG